MSEEEITIENIDNLSEDQLKILEERYKSQHLPKNRLILLGFLGLQITSFTKLCMMNLKKNSPKFIQPKNIGYKEILLYGTLHAILFTPFYIGLTMLITGIHNPGQYLNGLAQIRGKLIENSVKHDPQLQEYLLINQLEFFDVDESLVEQVKFDLELKRNALEERNYFSKESKTAK